MISVLLGAGASVDAGLPTSIGMTPKVLAAMKDRSHTLLQFVYGGLLMQAAARAASHYDSSVDVDVEALFNAVEGLNNRANLETSPFVMSWHPLIAEIEGDPPDPFGDHRLREAISSALTSASAQRDRDFSRSADNVVRELSTAFTPKPNSAHGGFNRLARDMVVALQSILAIEDPKSVEYLQPLVDIYRAQSDTLTIATLNYDLTVEKAVESRGVRLDDGVTKWSGSGLLFDDGAIRLLKLHGSVNWAATKENSIAHREPSGVRAGRPLLIFGGQNKLRADGPFLDMLWEWRAALDRTDHLLLIGYSFRDPHINAFLESWLVRQSAGRVTIIDPAFDAHLNSTTRAMSRGSHPIPAARGGPAVPNRVSVVRSGAKDALPRLISELIASSPS